MVPTGGPRGPEGRRRARGRPFVREPLEGGCLRRSVPPQRQARAVAALGVLLDRPAEVVRSGMRECLHRHDEDGHPPWFGGVAGVFVQGCWQLAWWLYILNALLLDSVDVFGSFSLLPLRSS